MRRFLVLVLLAGCVGGTTRPAVMPRMTEQPSDPEKRNGVLDSANATPGPEQRKGFTPKMRKAETAAATAAAIIGEMFSSTENTMLGTSSAIDENLLIEEAPRRADKPAPSDTPGANGAKDYESSQLVPWVKLPARAE